MHGVIDQTSDMIVWNDKVGGATLGLAGDSWRGLAGQPSPPLCRSTGDQGYYLTRHLDRQGQGKGGWHTHEWH